MKNIFKIIIPVLLFFPIFIFAADRVEINTATLEQLDEITGIGPAYAQRIIDGRPYSSLDNLLKVKGIGEKTLQKIKDQGLAYVEGQTLNSTPPPLTTLTPTPSPKPIIAIAYPNNILINEILPSPDGPDDQNEWIELVNLNNFEVDLYGWQIKDTIGKTTTYNFPETAKISSNGFLILTRPETKISLNNDEDGLELIKPDKTIADFVKYEKAPTGQSYNRIENSWQWSKNTSMGEKNIVEASFKISLNNTSSNDDEPSIFSSIQANIEKNLINKSPDFYDLPIAVLLAICSSLTILFLKNKIKDVDKDEFLS